MGISASSNFCECDESNLHLRHTPKNNKDNQFFSVSPSDSIDELKILIPKSQPRVHEEDDDEEHDLEHSLFNYSMDKKRNAIESEAGNTVSICSSCSKRRLSDTPSPP